MSVEEFAEYLDRVIAWATDPDGPALLIPEPEKDAAKRAKGRAA